MVIKEFGVDLYHAFDIIKTEGIIIDNPLVRISKTGGFNIYCVC